jgi:hypothetical protein
MLVCLLLSLYDSFLIRIRIDSCASLVILSAAKDLGREGEKALIRWPDSFDFAQDRLFGFASG